MSELLDQQVSDAQGTWRAFCQKLEATGVQALGNMVAPSELELAEGLRYLTRIVGLTLDSELENCDNQHPYLSRNIGPNRKMGGDNPQGHYLKAPINGADTFRISGSRGNASWISFQTMRNYDCFNDGHTSVFGNHVFTNELTTDADGNFEIIIGPDVQGSNSIQTDQYCKTIVVRQFFGTTDTVVPMQLQVENLTRGNGPKALLSLDNISTRLNASGDMFVSMVPLFQDMVHSFKEHGANTMPATNWNTVGGVPGGQPINGIWQLAPEEALIITVTPPPECPYWDIQVGNVWYETFDYRHFICGLTHQSAFINADGSVNFIISEQNPGTVNWLQAAGHQEGHVAIRWQLIEGAPPQPEFKLVKLDQLAAALTHLPTVTADQRKQQLLQQRREVEKRYPF